MPRVSSSVAQVTYLDSLEEAWHAHLAPRSDDAPTVVSTFAGCGGSSLGYSMAGFRELLAVEWDQNAVDTFRLNFPEVPVYHGDIAALSVDEALSLTGLDVGVLDVLDGSPPCQGFSTAGKRNLDDDRNQLFREFCRLLRGLQPRVFVMENVKGMINGKMRLIFVDILRELKACGYRVSVRLLDAAYFGVPQYRKRLIFVGVRDDLSADPGHPSGRGQTVTFRDAVRGLPLWEQKPEIDHVWMDEVARRTKWVGRARSMRPGEKVVLSVASGTRLYWDRPCRTIQKTAPVGSAPYVRNSLVHPSQPRTPSIREMARCQFIPDQFRFIDALTTGMHRIGNSVPPLFMRAIAQHIREHVQTPELSLAP